MAPLVVTAGMIARIISLLYPKVTKEDIFYIGAILVFLAIIVLGVEAEGDFKNLNYVPVIFIIFAALIFKDKFIPHITEGTLLLHGLLALYLLYELHSTPLFLFGYICGILILLFTFFAAILCFFRLRLKLMTQTMLMIAFMIVNLYIGAESLILFYSVDITLWGYFLLGFIYLQLFSSIWYLFMFMPITYQKPGGVLWTERLTGHAKAFEEKYIDIDTHYFRTTLVFGIFLLLMVNNTLAIIDWTSAFILAISIGSIVAAPPQLSAFTPKSTY